MSSTLNNAHSWLASVLRLGRGVWLTSRTARQPEKLLELWEFEGCPFCRKVREVMSELDLAFVDHPCAKGSRNRATLIEQGVKQVFPYLVEPNTGKSMHESEDIIDYLFATYGSGRNPLGRVMAPLNIVGSGLTSAVRPRGRKVRAGAAERTAPAQRLELYNFEGSPYCRKVREVLTELDLDFTVRNVAKGSVRRPDLVALGGKMMVPYLVDPNTGTAMYESDDIIAYLEKTYG